MQIRVFQSCNSQVKSISVENFLALFEDFDDSFVNALSERDDTPPQECEAL